MENSLNTAAALIRSADALVISAGAGIGVDSGLPNFRGAEGFWRAYPALQASGMSFYDVASPQTFDRDPELAWGFYGHRLDLYRKTVPHEGFEILRKWASEKPGGAFVLTSNVDGQFEKAGFDPSRIWEFHGSIHRLQCTSCSSGVFPAGEFVPVVDVDACRLTNSLPLCPSCGFVARPNILMFGDWHWDSTVADEQAMQFDAWWRSIGGSSSNAVIIELGAGTDIPTVRWHGESLGVPLIRINPREFGVRRERDVALQGGALETLHQLDALIQS